MEIGRDVTLVIKCLWKYSTIYTKCVKSIINPLFYIGVKLREKSDVHVGVDEVVRFRVNFAYFWANFSLATFEEMFPCVTQRYDLEISSEPDVMFYSAFTKNNPKKRRFDGQNTWCMPVLSPGSFVRVIITGENIEPIMEHCDFAISHSALIDHPSHLRLPLWACPGWKPEALLKSDNTDWEKVAAEKTRFCNFIYSHDVAFRNYIFYLLNNYKHVDAAGRCMNNMNGWRVPAGPQAKLDFIRSYKFTLAVESTIWPGYQTEKISQPKKVDSIAIYVGDPLARNDFDTAGYVDITSFRTLREMVEFVRALDCDRELYIDTLSAPHYRNNELPLFAREESILAFFDRIFIAAAERPK